MLDDREPEARAAELPGPRLVDAEEALRQPRDIARRDADPGVLDGDLDHAGVSAARRPRPDHHPTAGRRVLDRVVDEVDEHLPEAISIGGDEGRLGGNGLLEAQPGPGRRIAEDLEHVFDRGRDGHGPQAEGPPPELQIGEREEVVDQPAEALGVPVDDGEEPAPRCRIVPGAA